MDRKPVAIVGAALVLGVLVVLVVNQRGRSAVDPTAARGAASDAGLEPGPADRDGGDLSWGRAALDNGTRPSPDDETRDPALRACEDALARLLTPVGRGAVRERTDLASAQRDPRLNPGRRVLTAGEAAELERTVRALDGRVEEARHEELCEHWRAAAAAVERGDYRAYPAGRPAQYSELFEELGGLEATAIELPGLDDRTERIVILTAENSPAYFARRTAHQDLRRARDQAIRAAFARR